MGLDGVELVMALEESFGVELKDDEVMNIVTPRMVGDLIFSKLSAADAKTCQTQRAFYVLRRGVMKLFGLRRAQVTPGTRIRDFIPRHEERSFWPKLGVAVAARSWPKLVRPAWLSRSITAGGLLLVVVAGGLAIRYELGVPVALFSGLAAGIGFGILATRLSRPFEICIPQRFTFLRDLVPPVLTSDQVQWTRAQVSELVKKVVMEQLGVPDEKYTEDSDFIHDFGMD